MPKGTFINNCLFIFNFESSLKFNDSNLSQGKNDIKIILKDLDKNDMNNLNIAFFNAKFYQIYLNKLNYYKSLKNLIEYEYNEFCNFQENSSKGRIENNK